MATIVNAGRDFFIYNLSVPTTDTAFGVTTGYTPNGVGANPPGTLQPQQTMNANSFLIRCRTSVDMQFRKVANSTEYYTIPAGTTFTFDVNPTQTQTLFWLRSTNGTVTAEILITTE